MPHCAKSYVLVAGHVGAFDVLDDALADAALEEAAKALQTIGMGALKKSEALRALFAD